jgi:NADH-quinone oxidoreductase subunit M
MDFPLLSLLIFLPAAAALALCATLRREELVRRASLGVGLLVLAGAVVVWIKTGAAEGIQLQERANWVERLRIEYFVGVDGVAAAMVLLTALLVPLAAAASWQQPAGFHVALLFLETGMIGAFCALDLFLFYVFWEAMLLPMAFLIGLWGGPRRVYAAVKFVLYTIAGSVLMLAAILYAGTQAGTFDVTRLRESLPGTLALNAQRLCFLAFAVSFAIKVPLFPFHTWLPDAHVEAPTAGSVILAGVLLKFGVYGFYRFAVPLFPAAAAHYAQLIVALSAIGIVYGALMAMAQSDIKKLVAYSSVSHLGFCMLGLFSGTAAGAQGAILQMINHGISTGALFLLVGMIYERTHRRGIDDFGGMAKVTPKYATLFLLVTLSSIGLPGLNGFVGEFLVLFGSFGRWPGATAVSATAVVLGAVYMLGLYRNVFWGPVTRPERERVEDARPAEIAYLAPLIVLILALGLYPNVVLRKTEAGARAVSGLLKAPPMKVAGDHHSH